MSTIYNLYIVFLVYYLRIGQILFRPELNRYLNTIFSSIIDRFTPDSSFEGLYMLFHIYLLCFYIIYCLFWLWYGFVCFPILVVRYDLGFQYRLSIVAYTYNHVAVSLCLLSCCISLYLNMILYYWGGKHQIPACNVHIISLTFFLSSFRK
jgi:hypothetical protein